MPRDIRSHGLNRTKAMFGKSSITAADADSFSTKWGPLVLRFFQLFVGDQALAESLTMDTLAEHVCK